MPLSLLEPVVHLDLVVDRAEQVQIRERGDQDLGADFVCHHWVHAVLKQLRPYAQNFGAVRGDLGRLFLLAAQILNHYF